MNKVYVIAEAGVNHNGSVEMAKQLVIAAAKAGADAIKFQTFQAERSVTEQAPKADYQVKMTVDTSTQLEMLKKLELPLMAYQEILALCEKYQMDFLSTPSDLESLKFLMDVCPFMKAIKISSGDTTNAPLLFEIAHTGKPVLLSTGMCDLGTIETALGVLAFGYLHRGNPKGIDDLLEAYYSSKGQEMLKKKVVLLHCTTEYPAPYEEVNLKAMDTLAQAFQLPIGYSDHTQGLAVPLAAVSRGAVIIEKHFTLDRNLPGPDQSASIEPRELQNMVNDIKNIAKSLGTGMKIPVLSERKNIPVVRKSIVADRDIKSGERFSAKNIIAKSPEGGISPFLYWNIIGKKAKRDYKENDLLDSEY